MATPTIRRIQNITDKELQDIIAVCLRAYKDEVATPTLVGGNDDLRPLLFSSMLRPGSLDGHLYVLEINQQVVSVALWFSPGHGVWKTEESRSLGYNEFMAKVDDDTRDWWKNRYAPQAEKFMKDTIGMVSEDVLWWVNIVATDPIHQHRGYASMLMEHILNNEITSNAAYAGLWTTSKENVRFYNRLGYPTRGFMDVPSRFGGFPVWAHLRKV